jgi:hypothetical protein
MQKSILIENYLSCILTVPDHYSKKMPAILFLHGFGTDKNEVGNTFTIASEKLFHEGIASLRIDFKILFSIISKSNPTKEESEMPSHTR